MSKRETVKTKPTPTASEALQAVKYPLQGTSFVWHTLCRIICKNTGCDYDHAEKCATEMLRRTDIVTSKPIGLTETTTFKIADQ